MADPWLEGLYPALQKFLGVSGTGVVSLTETVQSLTLTESDSQESVNKQEHHQSIDGTPQSTLPKGDIDGAPQSTLPNGNIHLAEDVPLSTDSEPQHNIQSTNKNSTGSDGNVTNFTRLTDAHVIEIPVTATVDALVIGSSVIAATSSTLNTYSCEDKCTVDPISSHIINSKSEDLTSGGCSSQTKIDVLSKTASSVDEVTNKSLQETPVSVLLSQPSSSSLPIRHSQPPLSEQTLTIPVCPPAYLSATFGGDPVQVGFILMF